MYIVQALVLSDNQNDQVFSERTLWKAMHFARSADEARDAVRIVKFYYTKVRVMRDAEAEDVTNDL